VELFANPLTLLAENDQYAIYQGNTTMVAYAIVDGAILEHPFPQPEQPVLNASVTNEGLVLFQQGSTWYRCDTGIQPLVMEALPTPPKTTLVQYSGKRLFALTTDEVWEWDADSFQTLFPLDQPQTMHAAGQASYVISSEATQKRSFLHEVSNPSIRPRFITTLPYSNDWAVADADGTLLTLHDAEHQRLFLIDNRVNPPAVETIDGVFDWHWSKDHRAILTASANEVAIYHVENGLAQELLVRQTDPIIDAAWGPEESWIVYATESTLMVAERDNRDVRNIVTLATDKKHPHVLKVSDKHIIFSSHQGSSFVFWQFPLEAL
jgi:dipeptidyl aminopeptidase/acylaminoacyl peptidase